MFFMNVKTKRILYFTSILTSVILIILSFYIGEVKKATDSSPAVLLEALRWFQLADILYGLGVAVFFFTLAYWCFNRSKKK